jgi:hypothetical protein
MNVEIAVHLTPEIRRRAAARAFTVLRGRSDFMLAIVAGVMVVVLVLEIILAALHPETVDWGAPLSWMPVMVLGLYAVTQILKRLALRKAEAREKGDVTVKYVVTNDGLRYDTPHGRGTMPWRKFARLARFPEVWLLFVDRATVLILPADQMGGAAGDFVAAKVKENGGRVK